MSSMAIGFTMAMKLIKGMQRAGAPTSNYYGQDNRVIF